MITAAAAPVWFIAYEVIAPEMIACFPPELAVQVIDMGLHLQPTVLRKAVHEKTHTAASVCDTVIVGIGLCSQATVGVVAKNTRLVLPRVSGAGCSPARGLRPK